MVSADISHRCLRLAAVVAFAAFAASTSAQEQPPPPPIRVLILYGHDPNAPGVVAFTDGLREVLRIEGPERVELYSEVLDLDRFPDRERWAQLASSLGDKYRGLDLSAIVTEGSLALQFTMERLADPFPGVPVVYGLAFEPVVDFEALPTHVTGRRQPLPFAGTLALARSLQPDAERVVLVGGSSAMDSVLFSRALSDITPLLGGLELVVLQDWSYDSLLASLRQLPPRTIAILSSFRRDRRGSEFNSGDLIASITRIASAPVYGIARNWVGDGIVGGSVMAFGDDGTHTGQLLVRVLARAPGDPMPPPEVAGTSQVVDWRQLERWGLSERRLPPGTDVLFRTPTLWERYWPLILTALAIIAAQSLLIALLLLERRRRLRAQHLVEASKAQIAHIARVATVGELAAAISHEIRQPLTAIRAHAEAGTLLLSGAQPDLGEAREIFRDIVSDDVRATEVLEHIRTLLRREEPTVGDVDLNRVCEQAAHLLKPDAARHGVRLRLSLDPGLPAITGDAVELQQVVLNLTLNALDAVRTSARDHEVVVGTAAGRGTVEIFVRDTGPGLPPDVRQHAFEPFFSTKSQGLGMGLAIVRSIVERHHGQVRAENDQAGGAVFRVRLPAAE
jgi:signal transduction histidine kinase